MKTAEKRSYHRGCFKRHGSTVWEFYYTDETGRRTSKKGYSNLDETIRLKQQIKDQVRAKKLGVHDPSQEALATSNATPIGELVAQFEKLKDTPRITPRYRKKLILSIRECIAEMDVNRAAAITQDGIAIAVETIRKDRGWSLESANKMIKAMRSFHLWLHDNGYTRKNPAKRVPLYNERLDRRHDRRELTDAEISALFAAAMSSRRHCEGGPVERYFLCRTALETGFRKEEFRPLDKSRFDLGDSPGILLAAGEDKAKRGAKQPISRELAVMLKGYFATVQDRKNILRVPYKTDQMMRRLCERSKVPYKKGGLFADFHSWRHTFISRLANSSASLWVVMRLARHASIETTQRYVHRRPDDERRAIDAHGVQCAALAHAQDGTVRDMLAQLGTFKRRRRTVTGRASND